jgi:hypothetical protein
MSIFNVDRIKPSSPQQRSTLFFSENKHPFKPSMSAFATYNFTGPSVVVHQSAYMSAAADGKGNVVIVFANRPSYNAAVSSW